MPVSLCDKCIIMSYGGERIRLLVLFKCGPLHPAQIFILPLRSLTRNGSDDG